MGVALLFSESVIWIGANVSVQRSSTSRRMTVILILEIGNGRNAGVLIHRRSTDAAAAIRIHRGRQCPPNGHKPQIQIEATGKW
jgi:hypothetical protein